MKWFSSISDAPHANDALQQALAPVIAGLAGAQPDLVLLFVSDHHRADHARVADELRKNWPQSLLLGCSAHSVIGGGRELEECPGLSLTAAVLPDVRLQPFHLSAHETPKPKAEIGKPGECLPIPREPPPHFILLADPFSCDVESVISALDVSYPESTKIGGVVSGGTQAGENMLYLGSDTYDSGLVGVALSGNVEIDTIIAQGCRPIGNPMFVTRCHENVLYELDGRPPLEVMQELYESSSPEDQALFRGSLFLGLEMKAGQEEYHQGDFLIRNLAGADQENGALLVATSPRITQVVQFHLRDAHTSAEDLETQLTRYQSRTPHARPAAGGLLFSCLGRGASLYGQADHDSQAFRSHLGDIPLAGFFCNGEIGPIQEQTFLHGYTSAYGLFRARKTA